MKKLIIILLVLSTAYFASAQQKKKPQYMTIMLNENDYRNNMIITRTDSEQVQKHFELTLTKVKAKDYDAAHENQILQMLKVYFDQGWRLISATSGTGVTATIEKYYLSRTQ